MNKNTFIVIIVLIFLSGCTMKDINEKPTIKGLNTINLTYEIGSPTPSWLDGITASDSEDGNLTEAINVDSVNVNMNKIGSYPVTYSVTDKSGNTTTEEVMVHIKDLRAPTIRGFSDLSIDVGSNTKPDWMNHVDAKDNYDGIITDYITIDDSQVDYTTPGYYKVYYNIMDSSYNLTQAEITLKVLGEEGSITKPIEIGSSSIISGADFSYGEYKIEITINSIKRGQEVETIIFDENEEHSIDKNSEYILTNMTIKLLDINETNNYYQTNGFSKWDDFKMVSIDGQTYNRIYSDNIQNKLEECSLNKGRSCSVNMINVVDKDKELLINYNTQWFSIPIETIENPWEHVTYGIGYGIDVVRSNYADSDGIKTCAGIYYLDWLDSLQFGKTNIRNDSKPITYTAYSYESLVNQLNGSYRFSNIVSEKDGLYITDKLNGFPEKEQYNQYKRNLYYALEQDIPRYSLSLPDYQTNLLPYEYLRPNFLSYLDKLSANQMSYNSFFNLFGTHVISNVIIGGRLEMYCMIQSNDEDANLKSKCSQISAIIEDETASSNPFEIDFTANRTILTTCRGGDTNFILDKADYLDWMNSFDNQSDENTYTLIAFGEDGLIPIWELLPPSYEHLKNTMEAKFIEYASNSSNIMKK
ncbi:DUF5011 domain-containing protein [Mycoplasmatota bacterium]|nr:DUF5011 domain-containing protein [Mycoplasmatota bacterium]